MPTLFQSLQNQDLGHLHIIADQWGLTLQAPDVRQGRSELAKLLLGSKALIQEVIEGFPVDMQSALSDLIGESGQIPWTRFTQQYGEVREMGPGRRDREKPYLAPVSVAERLWYTGLIARAFLDSAAGPQEFAFIPQDLVPLLPEFLHAGAALIPLSRPAAPGERAYSMPADDYILDHATTLLAALRMGLPDAEIAAISQNWKINVPALTAMLQSAELLNGQGLPKAEAVRAFLEAPRANALNQLAAAWLASNTYDDLRLIPHLVVEGEWHTDPHQLRLAALELIRTLDFGTWWSLPALLQTVKTHHPNFLRPHGDYDSWYLKDTRTGEYLRGFEFWDQVEGAYLHYLVTGPLHWLGMVDLAAGQQDAPVRVFRFSAWSQALLAGKSPAIPREEDDAPALNSLGQILVPRLAPRAARYLIARFCKWGPIKADRYTYTITPASLKNAGQQGLKVKHLITLLQRYAETALPPNTVQALTRWEEQGTQVRIQQEVVLRVTHPDVLEALVASPAKRFLGTQLGPTSITVHPGALQQVRAALIQLGYLSEVGFDREE
jgi:hypothetical protein